MNTPVTSTPRGPVPAGQLVAFTAAAFRACDVPPGDAQAVAKMMVEADLTGASSHGVFRLPQYVDALGNGLINPRPSIRVERPGASIAQVDGDNGMGHLAAAEAARTAIELARDTGIGWVGVHGSNHAGAGSVYAAMPLEHGMIGIYATVSGANHMAPWGGSEPLLGTNPLAIAVPAGDGPPFLIDFATSVGSFGAIKNLASRGQAIPEGWMIDRRTGAPLTDPAGIAEGILPPIGGHKGSGLAIAIGLLAGVLNGAAFGREMRSFEAPATKPANIGQLVIAVDPSRFMPRAVFEAAVASHLADVVAVPPLPGVERVRWPGERRHNLRAEQLASGILFDAGLAARLTALAERLGIAALHTA